MNFYIDTYKNGVCVKNENGVFDKEGINIIEIIDYEQPKKMEYYYNPFDYFNEAKDEVLKLE